MTTPNPSGCVRCTFWDKLAQAVAPSAEPHWSFDDDARRRSILEARAKRLRIKREARVSEIASMV